MQALPAFPMALRKRVLSFPSQFASEEVIVMEVDDPMKVRYCFLASLTPVKIT